MVVEVFVEGGVFAKNGSIVGDLPPAESTAALLTAFYSGGVRGGTVKVHELTPASKAVTGLNSLPFLVDGDTKLTETCNLLRHIVKASDQSRVLESSSPYEQGEVLQWLSFVSSRGFQLTDAETLNIINNHLEVRVFMSSVHITLADLAVYPAIFRWMSGASQKERLLYNHISRWFNHIQNLPGIKGVSPALTCINVFEDQKIGMPLVTVAAPKEKEKRVEGGESAEHTDGRLAKQEKRNAKPKDASGEGVDKGDASGGKTEVSVVDKEGGEGGKGGEGKKKEKKEKKEKPPPPPERPVEDVTRLEIRVGLIKNVWKHDSADKLYCEEIDLGEPSGPRKIASGLVPFMPPEDLMNAKVLVLANMKPKELVGFPSHGMVLCSVLGDKTEFVRPPADAPIGERVTFEGLEGDHDEVMNTKTSKNPFLAVKNDLIVSSDLVATYKGIPFMTSKGVCKAPTTAGGQIQ